MNISRFCLLLALSFCFISVPSCLPCLVAFRLVFLLWRPVCWSNSWIYNRWYHSSSGLGLRLERVFASFFFLLFFPFFCLFSLPCFLLFCTSIFRFLFFDDCNIYGCNMIPWAFLVLFGCKDDDGVPQLYFINSTVPLRTGGQRYDTAAVRTIVLVCFLPSRQEGIRTVG